MRVHPGPPHFSPDGGGVETQVLRLAESLLGPGHEVLAPPPRRSQGGHPLPQRDTLGAIEIRRYPPAFRLGSYTTLFRPQIERADIVHLHGYSHVANDWTARNVRGRTPIVFSLHHGVAQPPPNLITRMKRALYDPFVGMPILRTVQAIVAASEVDRAWLDRRGPPPHRIHVIPPGLGGGAVA